MIITPNKTTLLLMLTMLSNSSLAQTVNSGHFTCNVKSVDYIEITDGKHKSYSGFTDGLSAGDDITFKYSLSKAGEISASFSHDNLRFSVELIPDNIDLTDDNKVTLRKSQHVRYKEARMTIGSDWISGEGTFGASIRMHRYYKSDWQLILYDPSYDYTSAYVATANCRHKKDSIESIVNYFKVRH